MQSSLKSFLDEKVEQYNQPGFIDLDPISIPHRYTTKEDIEISGLLVATIAWGQRKTILKNGLRMLEIMDDAPYDFVVNHTDSDLKRCRGFVHRTFNDDDLLFFLVSLQHIYKNYGGLEVLFTLPDGEQSIYPAISNFRSKFLEIPHLSRSEKHLSNPLKSSACKRLNMYLRWMVRKDQKGVDFGIWSGVDPSVLSCPLDVHSARVARKLGLLNRKQNDLRAVLELDHNLRLMDDHDPVKYDFALFGLGAIENFG